MTGATGPYCGLYALAAAGQMLGKTVDLETLIDPKYVGSPEGSSLTELKQAAADLGLYAMPVKNLTLRSLRHSPNLIILHVKKDVDSSKFDHYELFVGAKDGAARLFDAPRPIRSEALPVLASRWNGNGLVISAQPIDKGAVFAADRRFLLTLGAMGALAVAAMLWVSRRRADTSGLTLARYLKGSAVEIAAIAGAACLVGFTFHLVAEEGLLNNESAAAAFSAPQAEYTFPEVTLEEMKQIAAAKEALIIDARLRHDYEAGRIEGAINISTLANRDERLAAMRGVEHGRRIVVYCSSLKCKFAEKVAGRLAAEGYTNISIFRGGWAEWSEGKEEAAR